MASLTAEAADRDWSGLAASATMVMAAAQKSRLFGETTLFGMIVILGKRLNKCPDLQINFNSSAGAASTGRPRHTGRFLHGDLLRNLGCRI
jgi:hypothetical protein